MAKETKAERLFQHAYHEALDAIEFWGSGHIDALSRFTDGSDDVICQRTINGIRRAAQKKLRYIEQDRRLGMKGSVPYDIGCEAVSIVLKTCEGWEREKAMQKARHTNL